MPRIPFKKKVEEFINSQSRQRGWKEETKRKYKTELMKIREDFKGRKPSALTGEEILGYAKESWGDLTPKGKSWYWNILKNFLEYSGNTDLRKIKFNIGNVKDREVYWLDIDQCQKVREAVENMREDYMMIYHLGRDLGLRRCEMRWIEKEDVHQRTQNFIIPGKYDKQRIVPFHPLSAEYLQSWKVKREEMMKSARNYNEEVEEPSTLLMWQRFSRVGNMGKTTMDKRLADIEERSGVEINGFHTLRRTFAREIYNSGIRLKTIRDLLGHESIEVTERYIGIQEDKKREALSIAHQDQMNVRTPSDGVGGNQTPRIRQNSYRITPRQRG